MVSPNAADKGRHLVSYVATILPVLFVTGFYVRGWASMPLLIA